MRYPVAATLAAALLVLLAGCGGSSPSAAEQWSGSVCTAMDDWATQMKGYADDVRSELQAPTAETPANIQATVTNGAQATNQLAERLQSLEPPPTSDGQTARSLVDALATQIQQTATTVQAETKAMQESSSATETTISIATIAGSVSALVAQGKSTVESLQALNGELKDAFDQADSCKQLKKDFG